MVSTKNYLDPQVLAELQGLALRTRHIVDGFMSGSHRSASAGTSTEYSQHRPYTPGDDLRHVDWKAFGRTDRLYVKQFMDETRLACTFLLDASGSMRYQGEHSPLSKLEYASCLVASLAWLVLGQGDAAGLSICRNAEPFDVPPAATDHQLAALIQTVESIRAEGHTGIGDCIHQWARKCDRRRLVVIVSDLFDDPPVLRKSLVDLRQFGHEVVVFQVCDRDEIDFPFDHYTEFSSLEAKDNITLDAGIYRDGYLQKLAEFQSQVRLICRQSEIDFVPLVSDAPLGTTLGHFLLNRNRPETNV